MQTRKKNTRIKQLIYSLSISVVPVTNHISTRKMPFTQGITSPRWWQLKYFLCSSLKLEKMNPFWRAYFSDGLVQPPTRISTWNTGKVFFSKYVGNFPPIPGEMVQFDKWAGSTTNYSWIYSSKIWPCGRQRRFVFVSLNIICDAFLFLKI